MAFWGDADDPEPHERYRTLVNAIDDGIYQLDAEGHFVAVNDVVAEMTGYASEELLGEHVSTLLGDDSSTLEREIERLRTSPDERSELLQITVETADSELVPFELRVSLLEADDDDVRGTVGTVRDVSGRNRTGETGSEHERPLHETREQLEIASRSGSVGIWTWDVREDVVTADEYVAETYGMDPETVASGAPIDAFFESVHEEDRERVWQRLDEAVEETGEFEAEYRVRDADGDTTWVVGRGEVEYDDGEPFRMYGAVSGITGRKRREQLMVEQKELLERIASGAPLEECLSALCSAVSGLNPGVRASILLADDERESFQRPIAPDLAPSWDEGLEDAPINDLMIGTCGEAVFRGEPVTCEDVTTDDRWSEEWRDLCVDNGILAGHSEPIRDADGEPRGSFMLCFDEPRGPSEWEQRLADFGTHVASIAIERDRSRQTLREREQHLSALVETAPECIKTVAPDGTLLQMNPAGLEMVEAPAESAVTGECVYDLIAPEDQKRFRAFNERICRGERGTLEFDIVGLDGTRRHMESHAAPLQRPDGTTVQVALTRDVTEQKERERELERALDLLEKAERIADVGGWEIDVDTMDVFWSDNLFDLLGVSSDEEPPLDEALDVYHEDDRPIVERAVEEALDSGEPFDVEVRFRTPSGEVRWLRVQGRPETVDDDVISLRGAAQDVTERKEREQRLEQLVDDLQESNKRLEQFAYAASHDLQEPLRMVSSYLQMIERRHADDLDADGQEYLDFAVDGADRMRDMIEGLLAYSRVDTQGDPFEPVDLDAVVADACEDLQVRIEESDAEITADSLPRVEGDEEQLRQVFQNLVDNAIEYSGDEPPQVDVSAERREVRSTAENDGAEWVVSVSDEGIGIDSDETDRVFEVFESLHSPDEHAGTGIGLALCERIVERHGGDIWVDSEPGEGSTFSFTLPEASDHER